MKLGYRLAGFLPRLPGFLLAPKLRELSLLVAEAFDCPPPPRRRASYRRLLEEFARFTSAVAEERLGRDGAEAEKLYCGALRWGRGWRERLGIRSPAQALKAARFLYRALGIDFRGQDVRGPAAPWMSSPPGRGQDVRGPAAPWMVKPPGTRATVRRCFFSRYYSPATCRLFEAMDRGVFEGLSAGGRLEFTERISEGRPCCRAVIRWEEDS